MLARRLGGKPDDTQDLDVAVAAETMRSASASSNPPPAEKKEDEKISIFWRVFGGTLLSIVALVSITLFNNISSGIAELRAELSREREARAGLAKKEDVDNRIKTLYERLRAADGHRVDIEAVKERTAGNTAAIDVVKKDLGASLELLRKETAGLDLLREKLATVAADLKIARDDTQKFQQELEKNKAADTERKLARDAQAKQIDDTLKELQKAVQDCREKLARIEGMQPTGPPPKPATPAGSDEQP